MLFFKFSFFPGKEPNFVLYYCFFLIFCGHGAVATSFLLRTLLISVYLRYTVLTSALIPQNLRALLCRWWRCTVKTFHFRRTWILKRVCMGKSCYHWLAMRLFRYVNQVYSVLFTCHYFLLAFVFIETHFQSAIFHFSFINIFLLTPVPD